jgi:hypothetical protein
MNRGDLEALEQATRLEQMGITIRSAEISITAAQLNAFYEGGGNRDLRRRVRRAQRRRGRGYTR